jgi:hypothetical protein
VSKELSELGNKTAKKANYSANLLKVSKQEVEVTI